jgi:hypothetical protein
LTRAAVPFTVPHFRAWAKNLVLDTGKPWLLEPFQEAFVRDLFLGKPENWLIVPEGNGKTTLIAGLALYHCEYRTRAEVDVAASSRDQGGVLYRQAEGFVLRSPYLHEMIHSPIQEAKGKQKVDLPRFVPLEGYRRINYIDGGRVQIYAADDRTGDGIIPTLALVDELHRHRDMSLYQTWSGKLAKRQGQIVTISTAGVPGSQFEQMRERIRQEGTVTRKGKAFVRAELPSLILHEWAVPEDGDVEDVKLVKAANPLKALTVADLKAKLNKPTMTLHHWRRFVCNLPTRADTAAITEVEWAGAKTTETIPEGVPIWLGLDLGWKWDTTAMVPYWPKDDTMRLLGSATILVPPRDGQMLDPAAVNAALLAIHQRNPVHTVVMDPTAGSGTVAFIQENLGSTIIARPPSAPSQVQEYEAFMESLRDKTLKHTGDQGLTSHAMNAIARVDRFGAARFDRTSPIRNSAAMQEVRVIDALDAAAMVHAQAMVPIEVAAEPWVAFA